jgi:preprotein translocase subunit SecD
VKKNRGKLIITVICVLLSFYFLYPTYQDYKFSQELKGLTGEDSVKYVETHDTEIRDARAKRIKLGLDLQGGMRVVLEVNTLKLLEDLAKNKDDVYTGIMNEIRAIAKTTDEDLIEIFKRKFQEKQVRMSRYYGSIRDTDDDILKRLRDETTNAVDRGMEIVRNRVDQYGVSEPSIQKQGGRRIIVELPGVKKEAEVEQLLQGTALLEFKLLIDNEVALKVYESIDRTLAGKALTDTTSADSTKPVAADTTAKTDSSAIPLPQDQALAEEKAKKDNPFFYLARPNQQQGQAWNGELFTAEADRGKVMRILERPDIKQLLPTDMSFAWSAKPQFIAEGKRFFALFALKGKAEINGGVIVKATATIDPTYNTPVVTMEMDNDGSREWARITGANVNKRIAIIMDNAVFSAPVVRSKITGGHSQIEGMENVEEAKLLEIVLKAGALPAPVEIIQKTSVGASLGDDSIRQGVVSSGAAFLLTVLFMVMYYKMGGTMADVALLINLLFTLAVLAGFQGTLTLPGIAGIILTMAVAVDANVLIFERIREESVTGKTLAAAIDVGYEKAFTAIADSNITTFITAVILYNFGSGPVQGFALTLMIGILASMFSAIVITRIIFDIMLERGSKVSFG